MDISSCGTQALDLPLSLHMGAGGFNPPAYVGSITTQVTAPGSLAASPTVVVCVGPVTQAAIVAKPGVSRLGVVVRRMEEALPPWGG